MCSTRNIYENYQFDVKTLQLSPRIVVMRLRPFFPIFVIATDRCVFCCRDDVAKWELGSKVRGLCIVRLFY